jgi:hypothetical protein
MSCYVPLGVGFTENSGKILGLHEYLCDLIARRCKDVDSRASSKHMCVVGENVTV